MDRLQAMRVFVSVVELGSQSAAADHLDLSRPVVSRYLAELEDFVGARLLHRTTRKLSLTAAGSETLPRCRQLLELCSDMQAAVSTPDDAPRGLLRLSVSTSFGQAQLADAIAAYVKRHPLVTVDLQMLDRTVNLVDERIDLAIRTSNDLDPSLIARRLTVCRSVVCATPAYLLEHPAPRKVEDLARHNCLTHSYFGKSLWHFEEGGEHVSVPITGTITSNEATTLLRVTLAGAGVAMLPSYQAGDYIRRGELVRLLPGAEPRQMNIYAVYASRKHMPSALRSLLDFLVERFPEEPIWDIGL
ncbi:LysR family transcriptional regulator [Pseudomonas trivialis]|uniref:DNA-binding transcriptional regulator, LysR family n=1 Tax=Pseudomonas trivialis TaxID=200450 RepID=A0A0R2ZIY8_9PSED|nr:LysR family transcriptional regulator [Pseudomonas trivialis]KRP58388.1 LysR family transcriptional regulator [Pseudomonas trivialis]SDS54145.1 DNA-binding transcriptional regulator, LysR family [Pseudomonas trivialis]